MVKIEDKIRGDYQQILSRCPNHDAAPSRPAQMWLVRTGKLACISFMNSLFSLNLYHEIVQGK